MTLFDVDYKPTKTELYSQSYILWDDGKFQTHTIYIFDRDNTFQIGDIMYIDGVTLVFQEVKIEDGFRVIVYKNRKFLDE